MNIFLYYFLQNVKYKNIIFTKTAACLIIFCKSNTEYVIKYHKNIMSFIKKNMYGNKRLNWQAMLV